MNFKYWEWETTPAKEKMKAPSIKAITDTLFTDPDKAYRFAVILQTVKQHPVRLRDCDVSIMPKSVWYYYLEQGVRWGMIDKQNNIYTLTNRFSRSIENFGEYYKKWKDSTQTEELAQIYPRAKKQGEKE